MRYMKSILSLLVATSASIAIANPHDLQGTTGAAESQAALATQSKLIEDEDIACIQGFQEHIYCGKVYMDNPAIYTSELLRYCAITYDVRLKSNVEQISQLHSSFISRTLDPMPVNSDENNSQKGTKRKFLSGIVSAVALPFGLLDQVDIQIQRSKINASFNQNVARRVTQLEERFGRCPGYVQVIPASQFYPKQ